MFFSSCLPQVGHRHAFGLERLLQRLVGFDLVFFLDVFDDALELLGRHRVAELLAALDHQHLVDGFDDDLRRDIGEGLLQRRVAIGAQVRLLLPKRRDLPLLEVGLGDDLAVHLDQDLLEDIGMPSTRWPGCAATRLDHGEGCQKSFVSHSAKPRSYPRIPTGSASSPQDLRSSSSSVTLARTPSGARGSSGAVFRISALVNPGVTSPAVARTVHQAGLRLLLA